MDASKADTSGENRQIEPIQPLGNSEAAFRRLPVEITVKGYYVDLQCIPAYI